MKTTKRMLAFWLAVAILGTPAAPSALAAAPVSSLTNEAQQTPSTTPASTAQIDHVTLLENDGKITEVTVNGTNGKTIHAAAYSAAKETDSNKIDNSNITWSISNNKENSGVTIVPETGVITVGAKAKAGQYTITAKPKTVVATGKTKQSKTTKTVTLTVKRAPSVPATVDKIFVNNVDVTDNTITIPADESRKLRATALDQYGDSVSAQDVLYTGTESASGISIDGSTLKLESTASGSVVITAKCNGGQDTGKTFTVNVAAKQSETVQINFVKQPENVVYTGSPVKNPEVQIVGAEKLNANVTYKYEKITPESVALADVGQEQVTDVGKYRVTATYAKDDQTAYVSGEFEITPKPLTLTGLQATNRMYEAGNKNVVLRDGTLSGTVNSDSVNFQSAVGTMADDNVGTDKPVTISDIQLTGDKAGNYTVTPPADVKVTITKAKYTADGVADNALALSVSGKKGSTVSGQIPEAIAKLKTNYKVGTVTDTNSILNGTPTMSGNTVQIQLKDTAAENQTATIPVIVSFQNYEDVTITYTITVGNQADVPDNKADVSDKIVFTGKTVTHNGQAQKLEPAKLDSSVTPGENPKWTYKWTKAGTKTGTKTATETTDVPSFTDVGVYEITAVYEDSKNRGQKTATLKIEATTPKSEITVRVDQLGRNTDENYPNFSVRLRDESNGYVRVRAEANDYLDRQKINGTNSEWIGMEITPKRNGNSINMDALYVSTNGSSWSKISKGSYGNFYLDGVHGNSFYLWYDTNDKNRSDDLYLATDNTGSNKFQMRLEFNAYSTSSSGDSSGSSSTDKVNGDKVSTTTISKTPSVKNGSASVSITSSALADALEKNKKESKNEKADKSFIKLDVKTSKSVDDTTVTVPVKSLDKISDADTGLSLVTNQGTVQLDHRALSSIVSSADKSEISFSVEEDKSNQYTLMIKDGSSKIINLGSGEAELTFSYKLKSGEKASDVKVYRVGDGSKTWLSTYGGSTVYAGTGTYAAATGSYVTDMKADYNSSKKKVTFSTDALGTFLVTTDTLQNSSSNNNTVIRPSYSAFVDVPSSRWSAQYINRLASMGVINGTGGGYFEPTLYVSREEFVKMLAGVAGANVSGYTAQRFPDVSAQRWSAPYIAWAVDRAITAGTDGGKFAPTMKITREEMATMIYRYTQSTGKTLPTKNVPTIFADAYLIDSWAQIPVSVMQQAGIIDGNVVNGRYTFDPKVPATREECAKMLCILYDLISF